MLSLRLEPRVTTPAWLNLALPVAAVLAALVLCAGLVLLSGANVFHAYGTLLAGAFGGGFNIAETLVKAAPMVLTGLAVAVAFRARFWNIGAEGQLVAGAVASAYAGSFPVPGALGIAAMLVAGALAGAALGLVPGVLRVRFRVDDAVSSLLLNSIVAYGVQALIEGPWKDPLSGYPISPPIEDSANFPVLLEGTRLHLGVLVALLMAPAVWFLMARTTLGFAIRATGENAAAAAYAGIPTGRVILTAAALSGALAGLAGAGEVGGVHYQVMSDLSSGYGYSGIVIATLARLNPLGVVPAALFSAAVVTGAQAMSRATGVPVFLADIIQGTALIAMLVALLFATHRLRRTG